MKNIVLLVLGMALSLQIFAQSGLQKGALAPEFKSRDNQGKLLDLKSLVRSHRAVVLFFYRGQWCPYCNKQMKELQDSLQLVLNKGVYIIAVTPETRENIIKTINKTKASFSIIQDMDYKIMKAYDVNYTVNPEMLSKLKNYGVDLEGNHGNKEHVLPVPATYIIDHSGKISFVFFNKDYTKRASVSSILKAIN